MNDLDQALAALPRADVGELFASSIEARAKAEFQRAHARMRKQDLPRAKPDAGWLRAYNRMEPLLVAAVALIYLGSAASTLLAILG